MILRKSILKLWNLFGPFLIVALLWEGFAANADPQLFPPISLVLQRMFAEIWEISIWEHSVASLRKVLFSFVIGTVSGVVFGLIVGWFRLAESFFTPLISFTYTLPRVALIPLFILWLGIGEQTIVTAASIGVFFIVLINTIEGVRNTDLLLIKAAKNLGANSRQLLFRVFLPSSAVILFSSIRLAIGQALVSVISGEIIIGSSGLGYWIWSARYTMDTPLMFVILVFMGLLGFGITRGAVMLEKRLLVWQTSAGDYS